MLRTFCYANIVYERAPLCRMRKERRPLFAVETRAGGATGTLSAAYVACVCKKRRVSNGAIGYRYFPSD